MTVVRESPREGPPESFLEQIAVSVHLRRYKEEVYTVLATYLDESFDMGKRGIYAVGGITARGLPLFELDRKWEALLKKIGIAYYKASECEMGTGEFAKFVKTERNPTLNERENLTEISHQFVSLIATEPNLVVYGVGVIQPDFYEVIKDSYAHSVLGNDPFPLAYDLAMVQAAWMMKSTEKQKAAAQQPWQSVERFVTSFVRDDHQIYGPLAGERYIKLKASNAEAERYMGAHTIADDKKVFVLQAADAVAYEIRRVLHLAHKQRKESMRGQFKLFRDHSRMATIHTAVKQNLLNTVALHKPGDSFNLSDIMETEYPENIRIEEEMM